MIPILMPLADGHGIPSVVLSGITSQSIDVELLAISTPAQKIKRAGEGASRGKLFDAFSNMKSEVAILMNRDIWLKDNTVIERAARLVSIPNGIGSVHVPHKIGADPFHMDIGCMAIHKSICGNMIFHPVVSEACFCRRFTEAFSRLNLKQIWLESLSGELEAEEVSITNNRRAHLWHPDL